MANNMDGVKKAYFYIVSNNICTAAAAFAVPVFFITFALPN